MVIHILYIIKFSRKIILIESIVNCVCYLRNKYNIWFDYIFIKQNAFEKSKSWRKWKWTPTNNSQKCALIISYQQRSTYVNEWTKEDTYVLSVCFLVCIIRKGEMLCQTVMRRTYAGACHKYHILGLISCLFLPHFCIFSLLVVFCVYLRSVCETDSGNALIAFWNNINLTAGHYIHNTEKCKTPYTRFAMVNGRKKWTTKTTKMNK